MELLHVVGILAPVQGRLKVMVPMSGSFSSSLTHIVRLCETILTDLSSFSSSKSLIEARRSQVALQVELPRDTLTDFGPEDKD